MGVSGLREVECSESDEGERPAPWTAHCQSLPGPGGWVGWAGALGPLQPPQEVPPPRQPQALGTFPASTVLSGLPLSLVTCTWLPPSSRFFVWQRGPTPRHTTQPSGSAGSSPLVSAAGRLRQETRGFHPGCSPLVLRAPQVWCVRGPRPPSSSAGLPSWSSGHLPCAPHCPVQEWGWRWDRGKSRQAGFCPAQGYCSLSGSSHESNTPPQCGKSNNLTRVHNKP